MNSTEISKTKKKRYSPIKSFMDDYSPRTDYYEKAGYLASKFIKKAIDARGIRAIVTYRIKDSTSLQRKLEERNVEKKYKSVSDIRKDIKDIIGLRIALYFPTDKLSIQYSLEEIFDFISTKDIPSSQKTSNTYTRTFDGYKAVHYQVFLKSSYISHWHEDKKYCDVPMEIQVTSIFMHAWSEVEHDLVYKLLNPNLPNSAYEILDELNGIVRVGEIALSRLQTAIEEHINDFKDDDHFEDHQLLLTYLTKKVQHSKYENFGNGSILYLHNMLKSSKEDGRYTVKELNDILKKTDFDQSTSLTGQIVIAICRHFPHYYSKYLYSQIENYRGLEETFSVLYEDWSLIVKLIYDIGKSKDIIIKRSQARKTYEPSNKFNLLNSVANELFDNADMRSLYLNTREEMYLLRHDRNKQTKEELEKHISNIKIMHNYLITRYSKGKGKSFVIENL
jgi:ppGpp synthetase/RelA/SpoT-type nucleotidyltranferase